MSSIRAVAVMNLSVVETFTGPFVSGDNTVTTNGLDVTTERTGATAIPATKHAGFQKALSAGAGTIDFTALPGNTSGETVDGTGLKVRNLKLENPSTNANAITITPGASNGIDLLGADFSLTLAPGQKAQFDLDNDSPTIASGDRTIDLAGTGTQALDVQVVMG